MSTRFLDIFGLEHYHNLIMSKIGRRIYKERYVLPEGSGDEMYLFGPTGYTYDTGDENLMDVYFNGLRLDSTEYTVNVIESVLGSHINVILTNVRDTKSGEDVLELVLRK